ncbi:MAG: ATP-binding cassette domain-containing protein [Culicoidibacterales bacterium]
MLELKSIRKEYTMQNNSTVALNDISLTFKANEFVSILGKSGSGKTTMLNIIGGLDRYTSGDLIINGRSTKDYKDRDWDAYRNQSIGFVFQSYNLIAHLSILANVELALTLSGIGKKERIERATQALVKVGLADHIHKKPNQLSGGQMQRVSIARALVNDPEIILADEPTGALDSKTSVDIMNLLQSLSKEKLIIMVTHNDDLAEEYSSRIVRLVDGEIISDETKTLTAKVEAAQKENYSRKAAMSFFTAFNLSLKNLLTKKARTIITAFAGSIGIIGIALVLLVSNGFNMYISNFQTSTLSGMPVTIAENSPTIVRPQIIKSNENKNTSENITSYDKSQDTTHENKISDEYLTYLNNMDSTLLSGKTEDYGVNMPSLYKNGDTYSLIDKSTLNWNIISNDKSYIDQNYTILAGNVPQSEKDIILVVNDQKQINKTLLDALKINETSLAPETFIGTTLKILPNNLYYQKINNQYLPLDSPSYQNAYNSNEAIEVKIVGVMQEKTTSTLPVSKDKTGIAYTSKLGEQLVTKNYNSTISQAQREAGASKNVLTNRPFMSQNQNQSSPGQPASNTQTPEKQYESLLHTLGAIKTPMSINLYPKDFTAKAKVTDYLNAYNTNKDDANKVTYTDLAQTISNSMNTLVGSITAILIAFSAISLVVSSIMIGIITYVSVVERTKEIGILRSLGARKKDVSRVFNAETLIIGLSAGFLGVGIALLISIPATSILQKMLSDHSISASLSFPQGAFLIIVSMLLTLVSGLIPARIATKQDPVKALRSE